MSPSHLLRPAALFFIVVPVLLWFGLACSGDKNKDEGELPQSFWHEVCPSCGAEWLVSVTESDRGGDVEVSITNTGQRGLLRMRFGEIKGYALNQEQAARWQQAYPQARANRDALTRLEANGSTPLTLQPRSTDAVTLAEGQTYKGTFVPKGARIPVDTVGLVLMFGPIDHERSPQGLTATDNWVTWDATRPFFTIGINEVHVTPLTPAP